MFVCLISHLTFVKYLNIKMNKEEILWVQVIKERLILNSLSKNAVEGLKLELRKIPRGFRARDVHSEFIFANVQSFICQLCDHICKLQVACGNCELTYYLDCAQFLRNIGRDLNLKGINENSANFLCIYHVCLSANRLGHISPCDIKILNAYQRALFKCTREYCGHWETIRHYARHLKGCTEGPENTELDLSLKSQRFKYCDRRRYLEAKVGIHIESILNQNNRLVTYTSHEERGKRHGINMWTIVNR